MTQIESVQDARKGAARSFPETFVWGTATAAYQI